MRLFITINFVLLNACLGLSQGQDNLKSRGEVQVPSFLRARADAAPFNGSATSTDGPGKSNPGSHHHHPPPLLFVKDPKLCAIIVKRMKEFEATSNNGGLPPSKPGAATPSSSTSSSPKPSASGVARRSKLTQRADISLNRRDSSSPKDASASTTVDLDACKELETMIKAARDKTQADMKKGMPAPKPDGAKKESTPNTRPTDTNPTKSATDAKPKTESTVTTPETSSTDATLKTGSTDADS